MIDKNLSVWFLTGSQGLYGPETLTQGNSSPAPSSTSSTTPAGSRCPSGGNRW
jgi:hypothetical protein